MRIESAGWGEAKTTAARAQAILAAVCDRLPAERRPTPADEIGLVLADDAFLADLNRRYRGKEGPTNVLAFPGTPPLLGDVVIARATVEREAAARGKAADDHLAHLIVHGLLHLFGYDHETDARRHHMEWLETAVLRDLGIGDPYVTTDEPDRQGDRRRIA